MPKRLPLLLCLLALASCTPPRRHAEKLLREIGPAQLREEAAVLYKDFFAANAPDYSTVKETQWPAVFGAFQPDHIGAYRDGFALALTSDRDTESGLYIIPAQMNHEPHATARSRFERLADGIYWYSFDR